ncbi:hypothetical protein NU09_0079 [Flavobacterium beibuense]|uniref:Uncharacterized protein n=1 Tax=Flavobacterium beibuense TaxID=657326 RepID=A0A444WI52_9FLAO|nr:hypothetical protein NU09_0079 [Flavobacterium beibuense]
MAVQQFQNIYIPVLIANFSHYRDNVNYNEKEDAVCKDIKIHNLLFISKFQKKMKVLIKKNDVISSSSLKV